MPKSISVRRRIKERDLFFLMRLGRRKAIAMGHSPKPWRIWPDGKGCITHCSRCDMPVGCLTSPYPIETAVSGMALAYRCPKKGKVTK